MAKFSLSEIQAQVVLDMQLKRLQGLEREKLQNEYDELEKRIEYYRELLSNETMLKGVLKDELTVIRDRFGDDRLTEIQDVEDEIDIEDLIEEEQCVFTLSHAGYIKRVPAATYRSQKRGGRGVTGQTLKDEDFVEGVFSASTHDYILFFTNMGRVHRRKGYQIPEGGRVAKGTNIVNILPLEAGEKVTAGLTVREFDEDNLLFVTKQGHGQARDARKPQYGQKGRYPRADAGRRRRADRRHENGRQSEHRVGHSGRHGYLFQ